MKKWFKILRQWLQIPFKYGSSACITILVIMGCVNGKTVPESQSQSKVQTVYELDKCGDPTKKNRQSTKTRPNSHHPRRSNTGPNGKAQHGGNRTTNGPNKKESKWKAKFDNRVTDKYDIKALIGKGSFSRVVRVENKITKEPFAIKMIDAQQGKEVVESELNVLRRVHHTYIIQLNEVFESKEKIYMVMQLATGGELFDRIIAKGTFTERDATRVLQMVLDGLRYLHDLGITHRDLKPENLLYYHPGNESKILITDFGLSSCRKAGANYMMLTTCGTPEYIGPEILARKPYTCKVDMWAVGVITYILLSGTMPFDDENKRRLYHLILKVQYSYAGEVSTVEGGGAKG